MFRFTLALIALTATTPLAAQTAAAPPAPAPATPAPAPTPAATVRVALTTSLGPIVIALETERAPVTAANFLRYVDQRRFDGITFYRAVDLGRGYGLVQGGARNDPRRVLRPIAHEPTTQTRLSHTDGAISMARGAPGSANGDFFITIGDLRSLDAQPGQPGDNLGFAVFGYVVEGMDVVRQILGQPISPTAGADSGMVGQILAAPIRVISARRTVAPPPAP